MLKIAMQAIKNMKTQENNNPELTCGIFPVDNILLYQVKKAKLKKWFRRKSNQEHLKISFDTTLNNVNNITNSVKIN